MPTQDRTTIKAAVEELVTKLRANLVSDPLTAARPFRRVETGVGDVDHYPRPFLTVRAVRARAVSIVDGDKAIELTIELRIVADILGVDPLTAVYDQMGAVEDYLDSIRETGILDGAAGFDDRTWAMETARSTSGARVSTATAQLTLIVKVQRGFNRAAAP
jgi:hypothetical protein